MSIEQGPSSIETIKNKKYCVEGNNFKLIELNRDDVLEEAALILEGDPNFPGTRSERANQLIAKRAIRTALKNQGSKDYFSDETETKIDKDAYEVLGLFKKN